MWATWDVTAVKPTSWLRKRRSGNPAAKMSQGPRKLEIEAGNQQTLKPQVLKAKARASLKSRRANQIIFILKDTGRAYPINTGSATHLCYYICA